MRRREVVERKIDRTAKERRGGVRRGKESRGEEG